MNETDLVKIIASHGKWLADKNDPNGRRADLSRADLSGANLSGADLSGVNLSGADLRWVNLSGADLRWANLRWVNLSGADLRWANLSGVDLRGADLSGADLSGVNLSGVDLRGADLSGADLSGVNLSGSICSGQIFAFYAGRHYAVFAGGNGFIGCVRRTYQEWLDEYEVIGLLNNYTPAEIGRYGSLIKQAVEWLLEHE